MNWFILTFINHLYFFSLCFVISIILDILHTRLLSVCAVAFCMGHACYTLLICKFLVRFHEHDICVKRRIVNPEKVHFFRVRFALWLWDGVIIEYKTLICLVCIRLKNSSLFLVLFWWIFCYYLKNYVAWRRLNYTVYTVLYCLFRYYCIQLRLLCTMGVFLKRSRY